MSSSIVPCDLSYVPVDAPLTASLQTSSSVKPFVPYLQDMGLSQAYTIFRPLSQELVTSLANPAAAAASRFPSGASIDHQHQQALPVITLQTEVGPHARNHKELLDEAVDLSLLSVAEWPERTPTPDELEEEEKFRRQEKMWDDAYWAAIVDARKAHLQKSKEQLMLAKQKEVTKQQQLPQQLVHTSSGSSLQRQRWNSGTTAVDSSKPQQFTRMSSDYSRRELGSTPPAATPPLDHGSERRVRRFDLSSVAPKAQPISSQFGKGPNDPKVLRSNKIPLRRSAGGTALMGPGGGGNEFSRSSTLPTFGHRSEYTPLSPPPVQSASELRDAVGYRDMTSDAKRTTGQDKTPSPQPVCRLPSMGMYQHADGRASPVVSVALSPNPALLQETAAAENASRSGQSSTTHQDLMLNGTSVCTTRETPQCTNGESATTNSSAFSSRAALGETTEFVEESAALAPSSLENGDSVPKPLAKEEDSLVNDANVETSPDHSPFSGGEGLADDQALPSKGKTGKEHRRAHRVRLHPDFVDFLTTATADEMDSLWRVPPATQTTAPEHPAENDDSRLSLVPDVHENTSKEPQVALPSQIVIDNDPMYGSARSASPAELVELHRADSIRTQPGGRVAHLGGGAAGTGQEHIPVVTEGSQDRQSTESDDQVTAGPPTISNMTREQAIQKTTPSFPEPAVPRPLPNKGFQQPSFAQQQHQPPKASAQSARCCSVM